MYYFNFPCKKCGKPVDRKIETYGIYHAFAEGSSDEYHEYRVACSNCGHVHVASYQELVTFGRDLWGRLDSPLLLDWLLDLLECLVIHPCSDKDARQALLQDGLNGFRKHHRGVNAEQRGLLKLLAGDLRQGELFAQYFPESEGTESDPAGDPLALLAGRSVGAYTLSASAGRQFQQVLESRCPTIRVCLCHDLDASKRLKRLAKQVDVFVMVTASAKRAATIAIEDNRPAGTPLLLTCPRVMVQAL